jgi:coproporphyrinogen III oxidase-like Fe-S oxidoreductase
MMNALRLSEGVAASSFMQRTGLPLVAVEEALASLRQRGLILAAPERIQSTALGLQFLNESLLAFM